ncbi:O-antigen ligase family protein [Defluviimonas sp. WL0024]|uniref:O-antigen ligase family protein n=1 Tax=Albidovulum salinarum TaxID=2984153 RepID=A0ABT2X335_9RHOB|nr:O-antigen ligase family protein [Defluviimonas sp. WL0024]MCU9848373.1 O-antigen ligase family protein [Defluviimonas sp. WL0024]
MTTILLAFGLVLYPSTQLRFGGLPLGPGELMLVAWLGIAALRQFLQPAITGNLALRRLSAFWFALLLAQSAGMIVGLVREPFHFYSGIIHDIFAYSLSCALACMFALELGDAERRRRAVWLVVGIGTVSMSMQLAGGYGLFPSLGTNTWYFERLIGWSVNANQFAFFALFLFLLASYLAETARAPREAVTALACGALAALGGILSRSDALVVALMAAGSVFLILKSITWLKNLEMAPTLRGSTVVLGLLSLPLAAASAVPFTSAALERVEDYSAEVYADNGQGELRLNLWMEAWEKGLESGMIGYGPGPHLTTVKSWKRPPPNKFEAHNTSLDLFTQGGLVAFAAFIWICVSTLHSGWRARLPVLTALVMAWAVFSMFHFMVRHPIFWFGIVLCLLEAERTRSALRLRRSEAVQ